LHQVIVESRLVRADTIRGLTVPGHRNEPGRMVTEGRSQLTSDLVPVDLGQAEVQENDVGMVTHGRLDPSAAIVRYPGWVPFELEQFCKRVRGVAIVFHDQHAFFAAFVGPLRHSVAFLPRASFGSSAGLTPWLRQRIVYKPTTSTPWMPT